MHSFIKAFLGFPFANSKLRSRHSAWGETEVRQLQEEKQGELTKDLLGLGSGFRDQGLRFRDELWFGV